MRYRNRPSEYNIPPENPRCPGEIAPPPDETAAPPPERATLAQGNGAPDFSSEDNKKKTVRSGLRTALAPVAAMIAAVAIMFASFGFDPLGNDFLRAPAKETEPTPQITAVPKGTDVEKPTPTPGEEPTPTPGETGDSGDDDFPVMGNLAPDFSGAYAWSGMGTEEYIRMALTGDTAYRYLQIGSVWESMGDSLGTVPGASYDASSNTLTLTDCTAECLDVNLMGNGFTVKLVGQNRIGYITMWGAGYAGSVTFTGSGTLIINEQRKEIVGLTVNGESSESAVLVDRGVTVDIYGSPAILIGRTTMEKAIWFKKGMKLSGGTRSAGEFFTYTRTVTDENGNVVFGDDGYPLEERITLAEISEALGETYYDYSVVDEDGVPVTEVHFSMENAD